jgi:hypothetical protein
VAVVEPGVGSLTITNEKMRVTWAQLSAPATIAPSFGSLVLAGQAPTVNLDISPSSASLSLAGQDVTLSVSGPVITPGAGALVLAGQDPTPRGSEKIYVTWAQLQVPDTGIIVQPQTGSLVLTGQAPTRTVSGGAWVVTPGSASLVISGQVGFQPSFASLSITGLEPYRFVSGDSVMLVTWANLEVPDAIIVEVSWAQLSLDQDAGIQPASLVLTGQAPAVDVSGSRVFAPDIGSLVISGQAPTFANTSSPVISPDSASLTIAGAAPSFDVTLEHFVSPDFASLVLACQYPEVLGERRNNEAGGNRNRRKRRRYELPNGLHVYSTAEEAEAAALELLRSEVKVVEPKKTRKVVVPTIEPMEFEEIKVTKKKAPTVQDAFIAFTQTAELDAIAVEDILNTLRRRRRAKALLLAS